MYLNPKERIFNSVFKSTVLYVTNMAAYKLHGMAKSIRNWLDLKAAIVRTKM